MVRLFIPTPAGPWFFAFMVVIWTYAAVIGRYLVHFARLGKAWHLAGMMLLCSTVPIGVIALIVEHRSPATVYFLTDASWAFVLGDAIFLPFAGLMFTIAMRRFRSRCGILERPWWVATCAVAGLAAGLRFRAMDAQVYDDAHLFSPTKLFHDLVAYPLLFGLLLFVGGPAIVLTIWYRDVDTMVFVVLALVVGISGWFIMSLDDTVRQLDPTKLHPAWSWSSSADPDPPL